MVYVLSAVNNNTFNQLGLQIVLNEVCFGSTSFLSIEAQPAQQTSLVEQAAQVSRHNRQ